MIFWLAALKKKAGAKRPRTKTTVISRNPLLSASPKVLTFIQLEDGAMQRWMTDFVMAEK